MSCVGPDRLVGQLGMQRLDRRFRRTMLEILGIGSKETTAPFTVNWINSLSTRIRFRRSTKEQTTVARLNVAWSWMLKARNHCY